jgi:biopolymer transport protein ExbD/biopolymer transport protein TolR
MLDGMGGIDEIGDGGLPLRADINVTSLVDVAFVMLIIFMITAPIMQGGVDIDLPKAEARPLAANEGMVITVDRAGKIYLDDAEVSYEEFRVTFAALAQRTKPSSVFLRADRTVPFGSVVRVMAVLRNAGVKTSVIAEEEDLVQ